MDAAPEEAAMRRDGQKWILDSFAGMVGMDVIFPDAYIGWLEHGLKLTDYRVTMTRARSGEMLGKSWRKTAEQLEVMARDADARNHQETAGELYHRAALCYSKAFWAEKTPAAHAKVKECYDLAARTAAHIVERVEAPFDGTGIPALLHRPRAAPGPLPCVIFVPGMDMIKEDFPNLQHNVFTRRGLAVMSIDGPGQGESLARGFHVTLDNYQRAVRAVIDYVETRPEIDAARIGIMGMSMGSYWAPSSAAEDPRIKCCVAALGCFLDKTTIFEEAPPAFKSNYMIMSGSQDEAAFDQMARQMTLERYASRIHCPVLLLHGEFDQLCPLEDARRLMSLLHCPRELWIFENEFHSIGRWRGELVAWAADWLRDVLNGAYDPAMNREVYVRERT